MKFRYKKYGSALRPVIPIEIAYKNITLPYEVLVDSGADSNIFDAQITDILGLDLLSGRKFIVSGITGDQEPYYMHKIDFMVGGNLLKGIEVGFLRGIGAYGYGVVGQRGFFDIFIVKFDYLKEEVELKLR